MENEITELESMKTRNQLRIKEVHNIEHENEKRKVEGVRKKSENDFEHRVKSKE
jgi:hypothetical protein